LCLFAPSFERAVFTAKTLFLCAETNDPGNRQGNAVHIAAQWWPPVVSNIAQDNFNQAICAVSHQQFGMAIQTAFWVYFLSSLICCLSYAKVKDHILINKI
jgi:hypothetical protein